MRTSVQVGRCCMCDVKRGQGNRRRRQIEWVWYILATRSGEQKMALVIN
jgi:hypothetical protein